MTVDQTECTHTKRSPINPVHFNHFVEQLPGFGRENSTEMPLRFRGLPQLEGSQLLRALLISDAHFRTLMSYVATNPTAAHSTKSAKLLSDFASAVADVEAETNKRVRWSVDGAHMPAEGVQRESVVRLAHFEQELRIAHRVIEQGARPVVAEVSVRSEPFFLVSRLAAASATNSGVELPTGGSELLSAFSLRDESGNSADAFPLCVWTKDATRLGYLDFIKKYVGVSADVPPAGFRTDSQLVRRFMLELATLRACRKLLDEHACPVAPGALISFNVAPWLMSAATPWGSFFEAELFAESAAVIYSIRHAGAVPVIEVMEGDVHDDFLDQLMKIKTQSGVPQLGLAIDDEFAPGTGIRRCQQLLARGKNLGFSPLMIKIDHTAVQSFFDVPDASASTAEYLAMAFSVLGRTALIANATCSPDYLVFEGYAGWHSAEDPDKAARMAEHRLRMRTAIEQARQSWEIDRGQISVMLQGGPSPSS